MRYFKKATPSRPPELAQWWQRLNDLTLDVLIEETVAGNLDIATSKANIREARASYRQSVGVLLPSADGLVPHLTSVSTCTPQTTAANSSRAGIYMKTNQFLRG